MKPTVANRFIRICVSTLVCCFTLFSYSQDHPRFGVGLISATQIIPFEKPPSMLYAMRHGFMTSLNYEYTSKYVKRFRIDYHQRVLRSRNVIFNQAPRCLDCYFIDGIYRTYGMAIGTSSGLKGKVLKHSFFTELQFQYEHYSGNIPDRQDMKRLYRTYGESDYIGLSIGGLVEYNILSSLSVRCETSLGFGNFRSRNAGGFLRRESFSVVQPQGRLVIYKEL